MNATAEGADPQLEGEAISPGEDRRITPFGRRLIMLEDEAALVELLGGSIGVGDGDKGDVTVSGSGATWRINENAVTLGKMADMSTASILGRNTAGMGDPEALSTATVKTMLGLSGTNTGDQDLSSYAPLASPAFSGVPTGPTAAASTNTTQLATTAFVTGAITSAVSGLLNFKGTTDCSGNPNYPSGVKGDAYIVSVAGKIGGASGTAVDVGDWYIAEANNAGGTEASVGSSWGHMEHNLVGALLTSNNLSELTGTASTARTNLGVAIGTNVQAWNAGLDSWAAITRASGFDTFTATPSMANLKSLVTDETTVGWNLLTLANPGAITFLQVNADNTVTAQSASAQRTALSLVVGTNVQAWDADLDTWAGVTPGTGVATALAINVGSSGAVVTNGGALGTPSSGTATNLTGLPPSGVTGTAAVLGANTFTGAQANSTAGAASAPAVKWTGTPYSGGTATTNFPLVYINDSTATASTTLATTGTSFGVNQHGTSDLMNLMTDGVSKAKINSAGTLTFGGTTATLSSTRITLTSDGSTGVRLTASGDGLATFDKLNGSNIARLNLGGNANTKFPALTVDSVNGITLTNSNGTSTWLDDSTAGSGTVANRYLFGIAAPTLTATNSSVTDTVASTVYIGGAPTASTNTTIGTAYALNVAAGVSTFGGPVILKSYTVATLPSTAATGMVTGSIAIVTDALAPTFLGTLTGGSSTVTPVFYDGAAWKSF